MSSSGRAEWHSDDISPLAPLTLSGLLAGAASEHGAVTALVAGRSGQSLSYAGFDREVTRLASALLERFAAGDRIAVWSSNGVRYVLLQFAIARAGMIMVPVNPAYREAELGYVLDQSGAAALIFAASFRGTDMAAIARQVAAERSVQLIPLRDMDTELPGGPGASALPAAKPAEPVMILYTSGTTGPPKGAVLTNQAIAHSMSTVAGSAGLHPADAWITIMPMFHIGGLGHGNIAALTFAGTNVVLERYQCQPLMDAIHRYRCRSLLLVPTMIVDILDHPERREHDLSSLTSLMVGGAPVSVELARRVEDELGVPLINLFGQTETCGPITQTRTGDTIEDRVRTVGHPQRYISLRVVDSSSGKIAGLGEAGEVQVRGRQTMTGYWDMPDATAATISPEGWIRTGDVGSMDERGYLTVLSRLKDMIIRGGENIYPAEIEDRLREHPSIADAAVIGLPDQRWGEQVAAVLVTAAGAPRPDPAVLHEHVRQTLAPYKTPKRWYLAEELPRTPSGKVQKFVLAQRVTQDGLTELRSAPAEP
jgi:fatty-acyl-CoA synthase